MFLSSASIRRPVAMACLIIGLVFLGANSYRKMGLEFLPKAEVPYITIVTIYPGASPSEIETDIAKRLEDSVGSIDGIKHITNTCMEDSCLTFLEFNIDVDVDVAATDVREKVDLIRSDLPADAESPKILKFDINAKPVVYMALTGSVPLDDLYDYADNELTDRLSVIAGVAEVQLIGGAEREVHVLLDRDALAERGLSSMSVVQAIQEGVRTIPSGRLRQDGTEYNVKFDAEYEQIDVMESLEIANSAGARCYLRDVGRVAMGTEEQRQTSFVDGRPCVAIRIVKKADANAVKVVESVRSAVETLRSQLPGGMELLWVFDDGEFVKASVDSTVENILQGVLLTSAILFIFLVNFRSTLIVGITMPLTIVISLFFLDLLDYTLNISTLLALGLSVGILVTNSIVVLESVVSRLAEGADAVHAARAGSSDVAVAVAASAGTNLVVLFPIAMMESLIALFFAPFALSMVAVTVASLFISFTLTPILCALLLKRPEAMQKTLLGRLQLWWDRQFARVSGGYLRLLRFFAKHRPAAIAFLVLTFLLLLHALSLVPKVGFDFMSSPDRGQIYVKLEFPTRYSLNETEARVRDAEALLADLPGLETTLTTVGKAEGVVGQNTEGVYLAQILLTFVPKTERDTSIEELLAMIRARLDGYPDCIVSVSISSAVGGSSNPIELEIGGADLDVLDQLGTRTLGLAREVEGIVDPDSSVRQGKPEIRVTPRRGVLADINVPATALGFSLRANLEGLKAGVFKQGARSYDIRVKLAEVEGKAQVPGFLFPGIPGKPLILSNLAEIEDSLAPVQIIRSDKQRVSMLYGQLSGGASLGLAVDRLGRAIDEKGNLPAGYGYRFTGEYELMQEGVAGFLEAGLLAVLLTYLVLAAILESFKQPIIILITLPLGLIGVMWALYLTGESLSMFVLLGGVMLIGIVVNNAILVMSQLNHYVEKGISRREAMLHASADQLRPILMITFAAVLGMLPLALGRGLGSEMRSSIGIASVGGIAISAVLTLFVLPILYDIFTKDTPNGAKNSL